MAAPTAYGNVFLCIQKTVRGAYSYIAHYTCAGADSDATIMGRIFAMLLSYIDIYTVYSVALRRHNQTDKDVNKHPTALFHIMHLQPDMGY